MLYFPSLFEKHITHKTKTGICGIFLKYTSKRGLWRSGVCFAVSFFCVGHMQVLGLKVKSFLLSDSLNNRHFSVGFPCQVSKNHLEC